MAKGKIKVKKIRIIWRLMTCTWELSRHREQMLEQVCEKQRNDHARIKTILRFYVSQYMSQESNERQ
ncbi:hypothetical protein E8E11_009826 [Didymella keratinophila]|nr:hypothetical protein E8E11_009826 [Didymella keratinophila]